MCPCACACVCMHVHLPSGCTCLTCACTYMFACAVSHACVRRECRPALDALVPAGLCHPGPHPEPPDSTGGAGGAASPHCGRHCQRGREMPVGMSQHPMCPRLMELLARPQNSVGKGGPGHRIGVSDIPVPGSCWCYRAVGAHAVAGPPHGTAPFSPVSVPMAPPTSLTLGQGIALGLLEAGDRCMGRAEPLLFVPHQGHTGCWRTSLLAVPAPKLPVLPRVSHAHETAPSLSCL